MSKLLCYDLINKDSYAISSTPPYDLTHQFSSEIWVKCKTKGCACKSSI